MLKPDPTLVSEIVELFNRMDLIEKNISLEIQVPMKVAFIYRWLQLRTDDRGAGIVRPFTSSMRDEPDAADLKFLSDIFAAVVISDAAAHVQTLGRRQHPLIMTEQPEDPPTLLDENPFDPPLPRAAIHERIDQELYDWLDQCMLPGETIPCDMASKIEWMIERLRMQEQQPKLN